MDDNAGTIEAEAVDYLELTAEIVSAYVSKKAVRSRAAAAETGLDSAVPVVSAVGACRSAVNYCSVSSQASDRDLCQT